MKCQVLFSEERKENIPNLSSANLCYRVVKVKAHKAKYAVCGKQKKWSDGTFAHPYQALYCTLTEFLANVDYIDGQRWS